MPETPTQLMVPGTAGALTAHGDGLAKFMTIMRARFRLCADAEWQTRLDQLDDRRFASSRQWDPTILAERERDGKVCLTFNRIPQFLNQVVNQARASKPGIQVIPRGGGASLDTADVLQGYVRDVEIKSDADIAYTTAAELQAEIGLGYIKVTTEFSDENPLAFQQDIRIKRVRNRFSIYMDPNHEEFDASDARFAFQIEDLTKEEYEARFGDETQPAGLNEFESIGDDRKYWLPDGGIRIAQYWYVEEVKEDLVLLEMPLPDGAPPSMKPRQEVIKAVGDLDIKAMKAAGAKEVSRRTIMRRKVRSCVVNAVRILDGADESGSRGGLWPSKYIPIVPVIGNEIDLEGRVDYRGMVRNAKQPQMAYNYWISAATEAVALAPKAPWVMAEGQDENYEEQWDNANQKNYSRLIYTPVSVGGILSPPPQRNSVEPPIMAMTALIRQADNDLKGTMGFYDASLGERGPEQSGKAILARQKQGEIGNSQYLDNWSRAIRQVGRIVLDLIPAVMDTPRLIRSIAEDGSPETVQHYPGEVPADFQPPEGVTKVVDLTKGNYDVAISVGPSFMSKRQEAVAQMGELLGRNPSMAQILGDLWMGNMDAPWAKEAAERLKRMVPPQILGGEDGQPAAPQIPPEVQQQLEALTQQIQVGQQQMAEITAERDGLQQQLKSK
ncbi:MAG: hypothetical protein NUW22_13535, partial [Acidobacteria bacterium]|nr:hypothetical protein [Acidobacteriota bacterium]